MSRACIAVDIQTIGGIIHDKGRCAQCIENALCHLPSAAVCAVQTYTLILIGMRSKGNQIADVTISAGRIINNATDIVAGDQRNLHITVEIFLDFSHHCIVHLFPVTVHQLDAVIIIGVMACRNHYTAVHIVAANDIGYAGGSCNVQQVSIAACCSNSCRQSAFIHIAGTSSILTDCNLCAMLLAEVPAQELADFKCMVNSQVYIGFATEPVCTEVFTHNCTSIGVRILSDSFMIYTRTSVQYEYIR